MKKSSVIEERREKDTDRAAVFLLDAGLTGYREALTLQEDLSSAVRSGMSPRHRLIITEHRPVFTIGKNGNMENLTVSEEFLREQGADLVRISRGGDITWHGPGQIVLYPLLDLKRLRLGVREYVHLLEEVMLAAAADLGVRAERNSRNAGIWYGNSKLGSIGVSVSRGVTMHGLAFNAAPDLRAFRWINPCGMDDIGVTSVADILGPGPDSAGLVPGAKKLLIDHFLRIFGLEGIHREEPFFPIFYQRSGAAPDRRKIRRGKPSWLKRPLPRGGGYEQVRSLLSRQKLHTVCMSAACPNIWECFSRKTATFMALGNACTRACRFCNVESRLPLPVDPGEPDRIAEAVRELDLKYAVITSVTRDDLPDGGAAHFAGIINAVKKVNGPDTGIEVLIPDFGGSRKSLETVLEAAPDILNHNLETVPSLYPAARPQADYRCSLGLFRNAAEIAPGIPRKSGIMLGLGETWSELRQSMEDLLESGCTILTLGQYLQPTPAHLPVTRFYSPEEFSDLKKFARDLGFREVASAPLVRSSYRAGELLPKGMLL